MQPRCALTVRTLRPHRVSDHCEVGDAQVSEMHCNFLINRGAATAADIETLGEEVRRRVREASGVELHWEIKRIGVPAPSQAGERPHVSLKEPA